MSPIRTRGLLLAAATITLIGCAAAVPPRDLLTARSSYARASNGTGGQFDPGDLHTARQSLDLAEQSFKDDGDTAKTRDLAYLADRRAQLAEARGAAKKAVLEQQRVLGNMHAAETSQVETTSAQLRGANQQILMQNQALQSQQQQTDVERQRREEADKRAAQAAADLASIASVKQEARGMVITLSGSVMFASAKSDLLPGAQVKLNEVADALGKQDVDSKIVVEGHTDSQGATSYNQDLSARRAQAVRDYLVAHGISADRVTAQGFGPTRPVADNTSPEGRANNRRVEIVVQPGKSAHAP